jgi:superfamily II DNA or RNA helicase
MKVGVMHLVFQQGTLLLSGHDRGSCGMPPSLRWDPRTGSHRAPAFRYRELAAALRQRGRALADDVQRPAGTCATWSPIALRPYQLAALCAWQEGQRGMVILPTGSGKTRVACAAMAACAAPALCLVPTRALMHQWVAQVQEHYAGRVGLLGDGQRQLAPVTIATFESAYRQMARIGNAFELLVVDEVHHFGNGVRDEALEMCTAPQRLALTATAPDGAARAQVEQLMGPCVCELRVADLAGTWLADYDNIVVQVSLSEAERARYQHCMQVFRGVFDRFRVFHPEGAWREFTAFASRTQAGREALAAFRRSRQLTYYPAGKRRVLAALLGEHRAQRCLVFTPDNATAYAIAREQLIMPITCDIERKERDAALGAFRAGELRALVSAQVLNEGLDVPDAEVAIIVGGVRGQREHVQRVGRLLRPAPGKRAVVYEIVAHGTHETRKAQERRRALQQVGDRHG